MSLRRRETASLNLSFTGTCTQPDDTGYAFTAGLSPTADSSCGGNACVARKTDGTAVAWGDSGSGGDAPTPLGQRAVECASGYLGTPSVTPCTSSGAPYTVAGCYEEILCSQPTDTAGYTVTETELSVNVGFDVSAQCAAGYRGIASVAACTSSGAYDLGGCTEIDECLHGTAGCHADATCTNTAGSFTCVCNDGYTGDGTNACANVDECAADTDNNCDANAVCTDTDGGFTCTCGSGYEGTGDFCADVDECAAGTAGCHADATCTNTAGSFTCVCNDGYTGDGTNACADDDECTADTHNCRPDAVCVNVEGSFHCACDGLYVLFEDGTGCNSTIQTAVVGLVAAVSVLVAVLFVVVIKSCKVSSAAGAAKNQA